MPRRPPLAGRVVAITRPSGGALQGDLERLGAQVILAPAIRRGPPSSRRALTTAMKDLARGRYAAVAFTSAAAVEVLAARGARLHSVIVAAVGKATAAALRARGIEPEVTGDEGAAALAEPLRRRLGSEDRVLLPRAEEGRDELPWALRAAGIEVDVVAAYRTLPASRRSLAPLARAIRRGDVDAVVVASPSAVESLDRACPDLELATLVAIGPTTAAAARDLALPVVVAERPDEKALLRAVRRAVKARAVADARQRPRS